MKGLLYQLKNIRRDKLCLISFLLPILVGLAIQLLSGVDLSSVGETAFGIVKGGLPAEAVQWLEQSGTVAAFDSTEALIAAVNEPATQMIGVVADGSGIRAVRSGDELRINTAIADALSRLYIQRDQAAAVTATVLPAAGGDGLKSLLIVITMVTAMFMGCTFNAMNIIGEKEDGIAWINEIMPLTRRAYVAQKIALGFAGGLLSTVLTACVCVRVGSAQLLPLLLLMLLSAYLAAMAGLFIGRFSSGMMVGIVYIKVLMILFLAPPILFYLAAPAGSLAHTLSYLLPSSATFYGLMELLNGQSANTGTNLAVLLGHSVFWTLLFLTAGKRWINASR